MSEPPGLRVAQVLYVGFIALGVVLGHDKFMKGCTRAVRTVTNPFLGHNYDIGSIVYKRTTIGKPAEGLLAFETEEVRDEFISYVTGFLAPKIPEYEAKDEPIEGLVLKLLKDADLPEYLSTGIITKKELTELQVKVRSEN